MADELVFTLSIKDNASAQIDAFTRKINGIGQQAQKEFGAFRENFNKSFGDLGKPIQDINGLKTALSGLAGTGAAFAVSKAGDFIVDSVKNFAAYESALVSVQRTMGLTKTELDALGESLRTLALSELKGQVVADDLAVIAEVAGSLGVAKDDLIDFTKNVAMVATATDQSMEKVATSFGKIANVFKGSLGDEAYTKIGAIGSAFDKLADDMAATVPGMLNFVNRMGGVASSMGLTVDQTAALAATLESVGLPAERGATAMNNVMLTLMKNSKSFADALSIDADKLASALKEKPVEALQMVLKAMEELGQTKGQDELLRVMEDLMGKGNGVTEVVLKMQGAQTDFAAALGKSKQAFDEATRAGESFNQAASTQEASWKSVTTAVDDLSKSLGQQLKPATEGASQGLAILATDIANTFRADTINQFFDDIVSGFADFKSADLTDWLRAIPTAATQTISDLRGIVTGGITDILGGISELIGAGDWFAGLVADAKAALGEVKAVIAEAFGGGMSDQEYAKEMEGIFSAQEIGIQNVTAAMGEKTAATQADLDALIALKTENLDLLRTNQDLRAEYQGVARDLGAAIESGQAPTAELTARMEALRQKIYDVGSEAVYNSTFPDMITAMQASQAQTQALTAEMAAMQAQIKGLGAEYEATDKQIQEKQKTVRDINEDIRNQQALLRTAAEAEKEGIRTVITQMQNKKGEIQSEISDLQELSRDQKEARKIEQDALKESIQQIKEKQKAVDELAKNTQRTAELRAKQQQEEAKAANDLYREQQKQAADSIKWVNNLDDATKKRILGEQDAVKVLQEQGVTLTDLQAKEVRRMQGAYKTEQAYEAQAKALEKQLGTSATLAENMSSLGNALSNIGGALNIEGLGDIGGGLSALPDAFKNIKDSFSGLKDGLAGMKNGFSGFLNGITSITGAVSALTSVWKIGESIFEGIKSLFDKDTKSRGTEAAEAFQKFVALNVSGGAEMAAALKTNFDAMTAAGFDFQKFMQQTGTTMDQTFGGISQNWQTGTTAMDLFCQAVGRATGDMLKAPQVALQMIASFQDMGLSAEEAGAKMLEIAEAAGMSQAEIEALKAALKASLEGASIAEAGLAETTTQVSAGLQEIALSSSASQQAVSIFSESLTQAQAAGQLTDVELDGLSSKLQQLSADGQVTSTEIYAFGQAMNDAGVPTGELKSRLMELAESSGMSEQQIQQLSQTLGLVGLTASEASAGQMELKASLAGLAETTTQVSAGLQEIALSASASQQAVSIFSESLTQAQAAGQLTDVELDGLSSKLQQLSADGQVTSTEIYAFGQAMNDAGVPTGELKSRLMELAESSGMSEQQIQQLSQTLGLVGLTASEASAGQMELKASFDQATAGAAALDDELVGHSLVPSLQALNDIAGVSATPLATLGATAAQTAEQTAQASANVDGLKAALVGGAEEGEATGSVFDSAAQSVTTLNAQATTLSGSLSTVTTQLSGTGAAGASTSDIFALAQASAGSLTTTTSQLSGDLSSLARQLTGTGAETLATSNLFTMAGDSAAGLQGDVNNLDSQVATANASLAATQKALADIPNEKTVMFRVVTVGSPPRMATGGTIGASGLAIVNERGSEIAQFPGGGMALMTSPGATLGAFPVGTEIIPHGRAMDILSQFPGIPRMATGGTVGAMVAPVINITITGNTIANNVDIKNIAKQVSAEISRNYNARR